MSTFKNKFSWSISRDRVFKTCPRQYYFNYYGYWGGWDLNAPERTRQIYILKQLKNRHMWSGSKVHDFIKQTLTNLRRGITVPNVDQIVDIALNQMRKELISSREKRYLTHPKTCALFEHEYEVPVSDPIGKRRPITQSSALEIFTARKPLLCSRNFPRRCGWRLKIFRLLN
jgi:hypothetical protein